VPAVGVRIATRGADPTFVIRVVPNQYNNIEQYKPKPEPIFESAVCNLDHNLTQSLPKKPTEPNPLLVFVCLYIHGVANSCQRSVSDDLIIKFIAQFVVIIALFE
jgi:hypothetical protein